MKPREIVAKAWDITTKEAVLRKWGFASAFLQTISNALLFAYQIWVLYSNFILGKDAKFFVFEPLLFKYLPQWAAVSVMVSWITMIVIGWLFPHLAKGAIIGLGAKSYQKEEVKGGLVLAIYNFFPLFAIHQLLVISGLTTVILLGSYSIRYGGAAGFWGLGVVIALWLFSNILEFFWIFAEEAVVIRKEGVKRSISRSFKLVLSHLGHIVFLILLMLIIMLRIIANLLMVILVPAIVLGIGFSLTLLLPPTISYSIAGLIGLVIIFFSSYFFAYLEVFRQTVWTLTYIELCKLKDLDLIEVESAKEAPALGGLAEA